MIPIQELLSRIRWDPEFAKGEFVVGYYDRVDDCIIKVALQEIHFDPDNHFEFQLADAEGELHTIPFHRIKQIYKNGELIWQRQH